MKLILQRVSQGGIAVNGQPEETMGRGLVALVGFTQGDSKAIVDFMVGKMLNLRIFDDENGDLNLSLLDVKEELMVVSNFTLYANCKKGRRPSFIEALHPDESIPLYDYMIQKLEKTENLPLITGTFGANMQVRICNDGPVTIDLDSSEIMKTPKGE